MNTPLNRRRFLHATAVAGAAISAFPALQAAESPAKKIIVANMGLGRGLDHVKTLLTIPNVEIGYLCDVDARRMERAAEVIVKQGGKRPKLEKDVRKILEDKAVDALFVATPNFWHTSATLLACAAGKHVYVEKPGSGTAQESQLIVAAARKHQRLVQMGNQRRSYPSIIEAMEKLRAGAIGRVIAARCWYNNSRQTIGRGKEVPVPEWLDYNLWQGPLPRRPYKDNLVHYNWHWMWHWGNGELGNNGVHALDLARWGLGVEAPRRITYGGGRYHFEDDQETPDTGVVTFDYGTSFITWECSSCHARTADKLPFVSLYGEKGELTISSGGTCQFLDAKGVEIGKTTGTNSDLDHFANFIKAIRNGGKLNSEIEEGQKASLLCHLGNIAWRTGHTVNYDPQARSIVSDPDAAKLWGRAYEPGWEPKV
jgi:predicted dehydrogenase